MDPYEVGRDGRGRKMWDPIKGIYYYEPFDSSTGEGTVGDLSGILGKEGGLKYLQSAMPERSWAEVQQKLQFSRPEQAVFDEPGPTWEQSLEGMKAKVQGLYTQPIDSPIQRFEQVGGQPARPTPAGSYRPLPPREAQQGSFQPMAPPGQVPQHLAGPMPEVGLGIEEMMDVGPPAPGPLAQPRPSPVPTGSDQFPQPVERAPLGKYQYGGPEQGFRELALADSLKYGGGYIGGTQGPMPHPVPESGANALQAHAMTAIGEIPPEMRRAYKDRMGIDVPMGMTYEQFRQSVPSLGSYFLNPYQEESLELRREALRQGAGRLALSADRFGLQQSQEARRLRGMELREQAMKLEAAAKRMNLTAGQTDKLLNTTHAMAIASELKDNFENLRAYMGPVTGRLTKAIQTLKPDDPEYQAAQADMVDALGSYLTAQTGAQRGMTEVAWLAQALPRFEQSPDAFYKVLDRWIGRMENRFDMEMNFLRDQGKDTRAYYDFANVTPTRDMTPKKFAGVAEEFQGFEETPEVRPQATAQAPQGSTETWRIEMVDPESGMLEDFEITGTASQNQAFVTKNRGRRKF